VAKRHSAAFILAGLPLLFASAKANVITSDPGWTVYPMPTLDYFGAGPQTFGSPVTVTWSSTNSSNDGGSVFGYDMGYSFGANGNWDSTLVMAGLNDSTDLFLSTDTMTFSFSQPLAGVGGFISYAPGGTTSTTIAVYNGSTQIDSYNLSFLTTGGTDQGRWLGFHESTPFTSFTLTDNFIGIANLEVLPAPVPEPASLVLLGSTLLGALAIRRKLSKQQ